jgi:hypothetical protein
MLMPLTVIPTSVLGFFNGSKEQMLVAPLIIGLTAVVVRRRIPIRWVVAGILAIAIIYPTAVFYREVVLQDMTLTVVDVLANPAAALRRTGKFVTSVEPLEHLRAGLEATGWRLDGLGISSAIVRDTPTVAPYQYGSTLVLFFVAFIPRAFWQDKPVITIGQWITDVYGSGPGVETNTAATQVGEFFLNFGYLGVIGGMMFFGTVLRLVHELLLRGRVSTPGLLAAVIILYTLALRFESNFAALYAGTIFAMVPLMFVHLCIRTMSPKSAPFMDERLRERESRAGWA